MSKWDVSSNRVIVQFNFHVSNHTLSEFFDSLLSFRGKNFLAGKRDLVWALNEIYVKYHPPLVS